MKKNIHRKYTPEFKIKLLKEHLVNKIAVTELCEQHGVKPSLFYVWQKDLFEQGGVIFEKSKTTKPALDKHQAKINALEEKLVRKNEVLSELMEEHIALKKQCGEG
jgi:transposase